jgi:hypothetical protein
MAHSKAKSINQKKHGGKVKGFGASAPGDAPNTGMPVTPAPTRRVAPDMISRPRQPTPGLIGSRLSNIPAGTQALTPMAEVLKQDGDDGTLDKIVAGTKQNDDDQLRTVDASPLKAAHGMRSRTAGHEGGMVPTKLG